MPLPPNRSRSLRSARAERVEFLLLHNFHRNKYIAPEKYTYSERKAKAKKEQQNEEMADEEHEKSGDGWKRKKPAYAGGLVLEPKKGFYDEYALLRLFLSSPLFILLTDASGPPATFCCSISTVCTRQSSRSTTSASRPSMYVRSACSLLFESSALCSLLPLQHWKFTGDSVPSLEDIKQNKGLLPSVIRSLVVRRKKVKMQLQSEKDPLKREELDIRQKALKLVANSMYGCLGFVNSRSAERSHFPFRLCELLADLRFLSPKIPLQTPCSAYYRAGKKHSAGDQVPRGADGRH